MLERFTERARQVVVLAQDEAWALGHNYIGTEHILLGLVRAGDGVAMKILRDFDAGAENMRAEIVRMLSGVPPAPGEPTIKVRRSRVRRGRPEVWIRGIGWLMFAAPLAVGILIGWAIWGH